ncbi:hypothetical protein D0864_14129 [Hortaea werneckii]|uniref:Vps72/YL1 C-terminal domain-containing protein n=1 Tax=Hortaea werneckii TaxID=91943 RepID=A0A3M7CMK6_HORWE|nr:hypothetical protein KC323_g7513 [Hortaea werneckii]KAI7345596.1 hypothetical protein KC320_g8266 [Hortaea werneckii]RMY53331.1 hypothetical protein D0864_14129 [Hortaea werneckii]RMZ03279.1 hypothetical protein D0862_05722 [Hortaea werneckii]
MSDDESSDSGSEAPKGGDIDSTGLVATRTKRSTAGNRYASLLANLDDEEVQKQLLVEDEDDVGEYEGSDRDDEDEALESSSEEDDAGPPKEGDEDFEGEKALKKEERAELRKKRKAQDAKLKLPAWQKKSKKVKLADDVKAEDGTTSKPKKKSERANWLPTDADAPKRQSGRALAVANRESTHANLKQSYERSEKQRKVMKYAAERVQLKKRRELSQEQRMEMCNKIAKQTDKEFGRWEREEEERQKARDEQLAAKRKRGVEGPFVRHWTGSVMWEGDKIKIKRMSHGSRKEEDKKEKNEAPADVDNMPGTETQATEVSNNVGGQHVQQLHTPTPLAQAHDPASLATGQAVPPADNPEPADNPDSAGNPNSATSVAPAPPPPPPSDSTAPSQAPSSWLQGIHDYAAQQPAQQQPHLTPYSVPTASAAAAPTPPSAYPPPTAGPSQHPPTPMHQSWPPGSQKFSVGLPSAPPPAPPVQEQAQRSLIMLEEFEELENAVKRNKTASVLEPTAPASIMLPDSYPSLTPEETRYLVTKHSRKAGGALPPGPSKPRCAILAHKEARFRDPRTGLPYFDMHMYKIIQRVLAGGCQWSSLLGAWVGPRCDGVMGRPARGVPEGFAGPSKAVRKESKPVKAEQGAA